MRTWGEIHINDVHEDDILDRDKAIVELWDCFKKEFDRSGYKSWDPDTETWEILSHPVLDKYRDFVERTRS
jgi:hypothetical protein